MDRQEAKRYLGQVQRCYRRVQAAGEELQRLREEAAGVGSVAPDRVRAQAGIDADRMARNVERIAEAEQVLCNVTNQYLEQRFQIFSEIHSLPDVRHVEFLNLRYIKGKTMQEIREAMRKNDGGLYSLDHINHLHKEALEAFALVHDDPEMFGWPGALQGQHTNI